MQFRRFKQNKLWRDTLVDRMQEQGSKIHWNRLNDSEHAAALKIKLLEEADEVCNAYHKQSLLEELADLLEVIHALCDVHQFSFEEVVQTQQKKFQERGGFYGRKFVTIAEHPAGSPGEKYCLADPKKYPEIIDE